MKNDRSMRYRCIDWMRDSFDLINHWNIVTLRRKETISRMNRLLLASMD